MKIPYLISAKIKARNMLILQVTIAAIFAVFMGFLVGINATYSALVGGASVFVANAYFTAKYFSISKEISAKKILHNLYVAEFVKFCMNISLFIIAIKFLRVTMLPFFMSYVLSLFVFWFSPLLFKENKVIRAQT